MSSIEQKEKRAGKIPKPAAIAIFWGLGLILALVLIQHHNPLADQVTERMKKVSGCVLITFTCIIFTIYYERIVTTPIELWQCRKMIWKLAKNDFKKRYAGSYLGIVWAMVQPVVTVVMYWIVFDKVFDTRSQMVASGLEVPYVLYLTAGLVPWFFFSEAITQGTMALVEYNYLVKKVVFNISILPIIKVILSERLYFADHLLQHLSVPACAGDELSDLCAGGFHQGSTADHQYSFADRNVGNADSLEHHNAQDRQYEDAFQAESACLYRQWISERYL